MRSNSARTAAAGTTARLLVIDDEAAIRESLREILSLENYEVVTAVDGIDGLEKLKKGGFDVTLCDIKMPKMDGIEVLEQAMAAGVETQFIMISGHATVDTAVEATRKGAYDFIEKPPDLNRLLITIRNALDKSSLVTETRNLKKKVAKTRQILGDSAAIQKIRDTISRVAATDARVLITGANGTGKELIARWIHEQSARAHMPFIEVNCAAIPSELIESELFGHEKGAFTSAVKQRLGKFELADGATLFLDEIGDMSLAAQAKVLRALQENKITRVGGEKDIQVNVRVLAATNKNLQQEIRNGNFREDLYYRLSVVVIQSPALSERREDIPILAKAFLQEICQEYGLPTKEFTPEALQALIHFDWPGNVRELRNVVERLAIFSAKYITLQDIQDYVAPVAFSATGNRPAVMRETDLYDRFEKFQSFKDYVEREFIRHRLNRNGWNISKTADELDIQRSHLYHKMKEYGLEREENQH